MVKLKISTSKEPKKMGSFVKRTITALVMLPVVIGALWQGYPFVDVLALTVGVLLAWEWANMVPNRASGAYLSAYAVSVAVSLLVYDAPVTLATILLATVYVWFKARKEEHRYLLTLGVPYISVGVGSLIWIYNNFNNPYAFCMTLWFFLMVWSMDIGGYIVGSNLKGPKLAPKISPNKTWSGLAGGILLAMAVSMLYFYALSFTDEASPDYRAQILYAALGGLIAGVSQIGDLIESAIKRHLGLKDSSNLIPGHGGMFDRVDGLIFAAPFVYLLFAYVLPY